MGERRDKVGLVLSLGRADQGFENFVRSAKSNLPPGSEIVICINDSSLPETKLLVRSISSSLGSTVVTAPLGKERTFAFTYLLGYTKALELGCTWIIEMDYGAHSPQELTKFLRKSDEGAVFSNKISQNSVNTYPLQRKLVSIMATWLANKFLRFRSRVSDMTSGYEAFDANLIRSIFEKIVPTSWISVSSAGHLFQTEIRSYALWSGARVREVSIEYGLHKKGKKLPLGYLLKAFFGFIRLSQMRGKFS